MAFSGRYNTNPSNFKGLLPSHIHTVISARLSSGEIHANFFQDFTSFFRRYLDSAFTRVPNKLHICYKHPAEAEAEAGTHRSIDHVHFQYYHTRNCIITTRLWSFIGDYGFTGTWERCHSINSSFQYIRKKGLRNRISENPSGFNASGQPIRMDTSETARNDTTNGQLQEQSSGLCTSPINGEDAGTCSEAGGADQKGVQSPISKLERNIGPLNFIEYHLQESQACDINDYQKYFSQGDKELMAQHMAYQFKYKDYNKLVLEMIRVQKQKFQDLELEQLFPIFKEGPWKRRGIRFLSPSESVYWIKYILAHNGIPTGQFVQTVVDTLNRRFPKRNLIMFHGPPSSGKSLLCKSIVRSTSFPFFCSKLDYRTSQFVLQDAPTVRSMLVDEPVITNDYIETFKLLTAGEPVNTDVKFGGSVTLPRIPVFVCSNNFAWSNCTGDTIIHAKAALLARGPLYTLKTMDALLDCTAELHPMAWDLLYREYILQLQYESYEGDTFPYSPGELRITLYNGHAVCGDSTGDNRYDRSGVKRPLPSDFGERDDSSGEESSGLEEPTSPCGTPGQYDQLELPEQQGDSPECVDIASSPNSPCTFNVEDDEALLRAYETMEGEDGQRSRTDGSVHSDDPSDCESDSSGSALLLGDIMG